ncbi:MAG: hypothetical protein IT561_06255 [Alphaproteobacteria bacterium]|nr:hypothetical protein [Alphaproteobacteria bacterium]
MDGRRAADADGGAREPFVFFVTFPRSGHHYLVELLEKLFPLADDYCEFYHCRAPGCAVAGLPGMFRIPCHSGRRFQKHHDFGLDLPLTPRCTYVVQYRYPLESLVSLFEFRLKHGYPGLDATPPEDTREGWRRASEADAVYWRRFAKKWLVRPAGRPNLLPCPYESVTTDPEAVVAVLRHVGRLTGDAAAILARHFAAQRAFDFRSVERFRFFDRDHFAHLEREVIGHDLLRRVGYRPRFA